MGTMIFHGSCDWKRHLNFCNAFPQSHKPNMWELWFSMEFVVTGRITSIFVMHFHSQTCIQDSYDNRYTVHFTDGIHGRFITVKIVERRQEGKINHSMHEEGVFAMTQYQEVEITFQLWRPLHITLHTSSSTLGSKVVEAFMCNKERFAYIWWGKARAKEGMIWLL